MEICHCILTPQGEIATRKSYFHMLNLPKKVYYSITNNTVMRLDERLRIVFDLPEKVDNLIYKIGKQRGKIHNKMTGERLVTPVEFSVAWEELPNGNYLCAVAITHELDHFCKKTSRKILEERIAEYKKNGKAENVFEVE